MIVLCFEPQFAPKVEDGTKPNTVRKRRKRNPVKAGDFLSLRKWDGSPYRAKQKLLREAICTAVKSFSIGSDRHGCFGFWLAGSRMSRGEEEAFAKADGFASAEAMIAWFGKTHGLPFAGEAIFWDPFAPLPEKIPTFKEWIAATRAYGGKLSEYKALYPQGVISR